MVRKRSIWWLLTCMSLVGTAYFVSEATGNPVWAMAVFVGGAFITSLVGLFATIVSENTADLMSESIIILHGMDTPDTPRE